jgi:hypothetical protein
MTHAFGTLSDTTFDSQSAKKWSLTSKSYVVNMAGSVPSAGHTQSELRTQIVNAISSWYSTLSPSSAVIQFTDGGSTANKPSLWATECGTGTGASNGISEIGFCTWGTAPSAAVKTDFLDVSGTVKTITEVDTILNSAITWNPTGTDSIYNIMLHETGHWHALGDMYLQLNSFSCPGEGSPPPQMCDANTGSLRWGDKDGVRWLYPKINSFSLAASGTITGADSAVSCCLDTANSTPDMIFVWGDYSSGTGQTTIKAKAIWDLSSTSGAGTVGTTVTLATVSGQVKDIGATLYDVDGITGKSDLLVSWSKPSGTSSVVEYKVFWDVTKAVSGTTFTYGTPSAVQTVTPSGGDKGTDLAVFDMNGDGTRDLVAVDSFDNAGLKIYIYYGTLSSTGTVSSWTTSSSSGAHAINTNDDLGVSIPLPTSRIFTVDYRDDSGNMKQHYFHFSTAGAIDANLKYNNAPLKSVSTATGIGAGDTISIGEQASREQFFSWTDTSTGYYTVEWDSRLNSHL